MRKHIANQVSNVLELIHTDIYEIFPTAIRNRQTYFISFIDSYSQHDYMSMFNEKTQALDIFKSLKVEVELQLNRRIKSIRSDHSDEYYGRYGASGEQRL